MSYASEVERRGALPVHGLWYVRNSRYQTIQQEVGGPTVRIQLLQASRPV
jgi:hypothetical protein